MEELGADFGWLGWGGGRGVFRGVLEVYFSRDWRREGSEVKCARKAGWGETGTKTSKAELCFK